jgi:hypothetical protein
MVQLLKKLIGDDHVIYRCTKVMEFKTKLALLLDDEPSLSEEDATDKLCNDFDTATKYKFRGSEYTKGRNWGPNADELNGPHFDVESISEQDQV